MILMQACLVAMALADAEPKADADPYYGYYGLGYHGLGYGLGYRGYGYGYGLGHHYGYYGKRSAEPGYGYSHGYGHSYVHQSRPYYHGSYGYNINHSYGKRSADAEPGYGYYGGYGYGAATSHQYVSRPYSHYGVGVAHPY